MMIVRVYFSLMLVLGAVASAGAQISCTSAEVLSSIQIQAPADSVWQQLVKVEAYPEWHTYILNIEGELTLNNRIRVTYKTVDGDVHDFKAKVLSYEPGKLLTWGGRAGMFFSVQHYFKLEEIDAHTTLLTQGENWGGWFGKQYGEKVFTDACTNFTQMNAALKNRLENPASDK